MPKPTLLDAEFVASLPTLSDQLDVLDQSVMSEWAKLIEDEGGYDASIAVAVERVPGELVAEQFQRSWVATVGELGNLPELQLRVANLSRALATLSTQITDLAPQKPVFTGAQLMTPEERAKYADNAAEHTNRLILMLVREGLTEAEATALVNSSAMLSPSTLERLIDANQSTLAMWRKAGTGPPFVKNPGRAGLVRYPVRSLIPWLLAGESILIAD